MSKDNPLFVLRKETSGWRVFVDANAVYERVKGLPSPGEGSPTPTEKFRYLLAAFQIAPQLVAMKKRLVALNIHESYGVLQDLRAAMISGARGMPYYMSLGDASRSTITSSKELALELTFFVGRYLNIKLAQEDIHVEYYLSKTRPPLATDLRDMPAFSTKDRQVLQKIADGRIVFQYQPTVGVVVSAEPAAVERLIAGHALRVGYDGTWEVLPFGDALLEGRKPKRGLTRGRKS